VCWSGGTYPHRRALAFMPSASGGRELEPVVLALGRWGSRAPFPPRRQAPGDRCFRARSQDPVRSVSIGWAESELRAAAWGAPFSRAREWRAARDHQVGRGGPRRGDRGDTASLSAVLWHGRRLGEARRSGDVKIAGSVRAVEQFLKLFPGAHARCGLVHGRRAASLVQANHGTVA